MTRAIPFTRGRLCARMSGYPEDVVFSPSRLLHPLRRTGKKGEARFERVSWDEALEEVAGRLKAIIAEHGPTAVIPYSYAGTEGLVQGRALSDRFFARMGASRLQRDVCGSAAHAGLSATLGTSTACLPADLAHSRFILVWGGNPAVSNEHGWDFALEAKKKGARIVVVDPLRSRTAEQADVHLRPLPGTDAALALGMMHVIVRDGLHDADYVGRHTVGFEPLAARLREYPPERVASITGLRADAIVELARSYATTRPAAIRLMIGLEHHANGANTVPHHRLPARARRLVARARRRPRRVQRRPVRRRAERARVRRRPRGGPEGPLDQHGPDRRARSPTRTLAPPLKALVVYNSNPAVIAPNQNLVRQGLSREDLLTVVVEQQLTDTARFADYVFPATTELEHLDLFRSWGQEYLALNQPALSPRGEARTNTEFFRGLARRMGYTEAYLYESDEQIVRGLLDSRHPYLGGAGYDQLRERGWLRLALPEPYLPFANGGFRTPSGKCEFVVEGVRRRRARPSARLRPAARRRGADRAALPARSPHLEGDPALQQLEPRGRGAPAPGGGRAAAADARVGRRRAPGARRRHGARVQPPGLDDAARPRAGRHAGRGRLAAAGLLAQPAAGRLLGQRAHARRRERPGRRRRLPRRAGRGGAGGGLRLARGYRREMHASFSRWPRR